MKKDVAQFLEFAYKKLDLLKKSERGEVWRAVSNQSGELVIIKRVNEIGLPYEALKKFRFTLPAKIFLCAVDEDESDTVIVEEFIHGENLLTRLEQKIFFSEDEARKILLQMCDGLKELHAQKIIHRDIKPSNLILQGDRIRLIDFDAARIFKPEKNSDTQLFGTKGYAPPEQYGGRQTDERSDIYSLGVTMKVLLGDNLRGQLEKILDKCTEFDPKNRFQNVDELKAALTAEVAEEPADSTDFTATNYFSNVDERKIISTADESPRRKNFWLTGIIFVAAAIFLFANVPTLNRDENFSEPVENVSPVVEENLIVTPAQVDEKTSAETSEFKLPTIAAPQQNFQLPNLPETRQSRPSRQQNFDLPAMTIPQLQPVTPVEEIPQPINPQPVTPEKNYSGLIKTEFFLNDSPFNQFEHVGTPTKISRDEWRQTSARLHIVNDSGKVWNNPRVKFILGQNRGGQFTDTKILPALGVDESTDVIIPFNLMNVSDRPNTSAYIQIWLEGDGAQSDEKYWCTWFDLTD